VAAKRIAATTVGVIFAWCAVATPVAASPWVPSGQAVSVGGVPAAYFAKKKKKKKPKPAAEEPAGPLLTPEQAEPKRQAIRDSVQGARDAGDYTRAAEGLERNGQDLGDPIILIEAGETRLDVAAKQRDAEAAAKGIEDTRIALDILHVFAEVEAGSATTEWIVIAPGDSTALISRAEEQLDRGETLLGEIEAEKAAAAQASAGKSGDKKQKKKKKKGKRDKGDAKPGTGMIAAGSVFTVVGVAGIGMVIAGVTTSAAKQKEVEKLDRTDPKVDDLDAAGNRANLIAYIGAGMAVAGLAVGLPLIIIGAKRRKQGKSTPASAAIRRHDLAVAPSFGANGGGFSLRGRF
jgi:hypothetical protein